MSADRFGRCCLSFRRNTYPARPDSRDEPSRSRHALPFPAWPSPWLELGIRLAHGQALALALPRALLAAWQKSADRVATKRCVLHSEKRTNHPWSTHWPLELAHKPVARSPFPRRTVQSAAPTGSSDTACAG